MKEMRPQWNHHLAEFEGDDCGCVIIKGKIEGVYYISLCSDNGLLFHFPIPETYRGFLQVCNLLKIFHT